MLEERIVVGVSFAILGGTEGKTRDNTGRTERLTNSLKKGCK